MDFATLKKRYNEEIPQLFSGFDEIGKRISSLEFESHNVTTRTGLEILEKYRQEIQEMVDRHFDHLKMSYLALAATIPCKETTIILSDIIEETKKELNFFHAKFNSNDVNEIDVRMYRNRQYMMKNKKMEDILNVLVTPRVNVTFEEPEIILNPKVYSRLYQTLCEFITTSLYHDMPQQQEAEKNGFLLIQRPDYFNNPDRILPAINEEQKQLSIYSLLYEKTTSIALNISGELPDSSSVIITPDSVIYVCGGVLLSNSNLSNKTFMFDTNKDCLVEMSNMIVKKAGHSLCYINTEAGGFIYSIGGRTNDGVRTKICEKYDVLGNKWQKIALLNSARSRAAVSPFNDRFIYAFYGTGSDMLNVMTCEKYDVYLNFWDKIVIYNDFTGFEVSFAGAVQINEKQILIFGGFSENEQEMGSVNFSRRILTFNVNNNTFRAHPDQIPLDFSLSSSSTPIVEHNEVYCLGFFLQSMKPQTTRFLDCDYVLKISDNKCEVKHLVVMADKKKDLKGSTGDHKL